MTSLQGFSLLISVGIYSFKFKYDSKQAEQAVTRVLYSQIDATAFSSD